MSRSSSITKLDDSENLVCQTLCKFSSEEPGDLSFEEGESLTVIGVREDGWWKAKNSSGETGYVPSNFLKVPSDMKLIAKLAIESEKKKGKNISKQDSHLTPEESNLPTGFHRPKLLELLMKDSSFTMGTFLSPKLDSFGLSFDDIHYEIPTASLKPNSTFIEKVIELVAVRQVPRPPPGYAIKSCQVRLCLHDGNKILSNIHTVKARQDENSPKIWTFKVKIQLSSKSSSLEDGEVFIRSDIVYPTLGVLFELSMGFEKAFCDEYEMSCGWSFMRLLNESGATIKNKTRILKVQQSELFANHLSHMSSPGKTGLWQKIRDQQKMVRIVVSISNPSRSAIQQMGFLPSTLIGPLSCVSIISLYRKIMCDDLLQKAIFDSTDWIDSPFLANVHRIFSEPDITNFLRRLWAEEMKTYKSSSVRRENAKKRAFRKLFISTLLPAICSNSLPSYKFGHWENEKLREQELSRLIAIKRNCKDGVLALSSEIEFPPLSMTVLCTRIVH